VFCRGDRERPATLCCLVGEERSPSLDAHKWPAPAQQHGERISTAGKSKRAIATELGLHRTSVRHLLEAARHK